MTFAPLKCTLVACMSFAALAGAAQADNSPRAVVEFQSEQLLTVQGRNALRARIAESAEDVCSVPRGRELELRRERQDCIQNAIEQAVQQLELKIAAAAERRLARTETNREAQG